MLITQLGYGDITHMLGEVIEIIRKNHDELSRIDAQTGDGDHGVTMVRAMNKIGETIASHTPGDISSLLGDIAWALMGIDGGATGALYGSLFLGMADAAAGKIELSGADFAALMESGLDSIQQQTKARVGDKTLMDALIPAVQAIRKAADAGQDFPAILQAAAAASRVGAESTRNIPARFGRAKFQGERSIGHLDPGSVSIALVFQGFLDGLSKN
jgi:dihydroxyacetone kinase-like protein